MSLTFPAHICSI